MLQKNEATLLEEQIRYLKEHKKRIFKEYEGMKFGMSLFLVYPISSIAFIELNKVFGKVAVDLLDERVIFDLFGDVMDEWDIKKDDDFSLKEMLKKEVKTSIIANFVLKSHRENKTYFPSQIKRKEKVLNNAYERASKVIDTYFADKDILYSEIKDVIEDYEIVASADGKVVDFHFGFGGFSLNEKSSCELIEYVADEKNKKVLIRSEMEYQNKSIFMKLKEFANNTITQEMAEYLIKGREKIADCYHRSSQEMDQNVKESTLAFEKLFSILEVFQKQNFMLPSEADVFLNQGKIALGYLVTDFSEKPDEIISQINGYKKVESLIKGIGEPLEEPGMNCKITFHNNRLNISMSVRKGVGFRNVDPQNIEEGLAALSENIRDIRINKVNIVLICEDGKLFRETGEQVLTSDVIVYELLEKARNADEESFLSKERAKQMFLSVLSEKEEEMLREENITIIEGKENYYALVDKYYNNIIKVPKVSKGENKMTALCIHPADSSIPMYDGFASIALSIKSGDEEYVLKNSNEFFVTSDLKNKIKKMIKKVFENESKQLSYI